MQPDQDNAPLRSGVLFGFAAYGFWGVFPIYFKFLDAVAPTEILIHRILWAVPFGALILTLRRQWPELRRGVGNLQVLFWLTLSALCISGNWFVYIWAVVNERIFETSLGYYINPLMYVLVGVLFFSERLRRAQIVAVALASLGVVVLAVQGGALPWVSLALAGLFTAYGVIRKQVDIAAMPGLFAETAILFPFALVWMFWLAGAGQEAFPGYRVETNILLVLAGPVTVLPLLCFAIAARQVSLTTLGFMQFIAPTLQFLTALYYGEELTFGIVTCFVCIWSAAAVFSFDALRWSRRQRRIPA
jgi:chloramphenicol-sensitive protein RarD